MPRVHIPAAMRSLTGGDAQVDVSGSTLAGVIDSLEERFPGLKERMTEGGRLRRGLAAFVNDQSPSAGLQTPVGPDDEVYFAPAIAGGLVPSEFTRCAGPVALRVRPQR